ncbi:hypothetical protein EBU94_04855 [bacterium]|nr:hypothetical protein [bacterium]
MIEICLSVLGVFLFGFFYQYFDSYNRERILRKRGWEKTKINGVIGFERNHHFISEKRLKIMSSKSFLRRLEIGR